MAFDAKEYEKAFNILKPYADKGNCLAQYVIGFSYGYGLHVQKNDSLAIHWLELAAEQKQTNAMGPLAAAYSQHDIVKAYLWAMLAFEYVPVQKFTTTRIVIKSYMKENEIAEAEKLIEAYKQRWKDTPNCQ